MSSGTPIVAGLGDGDRAPARSRAPSRAALLHRDRVAVALLAGGGVGVARVDDGRADRPRVAAVPADPHRRRGGGVAGEQQRRGGRRASRRRAIPTSVPPDSFRPQADARRRGTRARAPVGSSSSTPSGGVDPARAEERLRAHGHSPSASSSPSIRFRFWTACPAAPFQRLSIAAKTSTRPPRVDVDVDAAEVRVAHLARPGRPVEHLDEPLVAVALRVELAQLRRRRAPGSAARSRRPARPGRAGAGAGRRSATGRGRRASAASSCAISGSWRWPAVPYGVAFSSTVTKWRRSPPPRPAPETPDLASTTTSSIRPASASGASARIVAVG